jgi:hypothetical protein
LVVWGRNGLVARRARRRAIVFTRAKDVRAGVGGSTRANRIAQRRTARRDTLDGRIAQDIAPTVVFLVGGRLRDRLRHGTLGIHTGLIYQLVRRLNLLITGGRGRIYLLVGLIKRGGCFGVRDRLVIFGPHQPLEQIHGGALLRGNAIGIAKGGFLLFERILILLIVGIRPSRAVIHAWRRLILLMSFLVSN